VVHPGFLGGGFWFPILILIRPSPQRRSRDHRNAVFAAAMTWISWPHHHIDITFPWYTLIGSSVTLAVAFIMSKLMPQTGPNIQH